MGRCAPGAPVQVLAAALVLVALAPGPAGGTGPALLVTIGDVTATTAVVWARLPAPGEVAVSLKPAAGEGGARGTLEITRRADFTGKLVLSGLTPATQELLRATSVDAIWDDHEVRNDFSGPTEPLMPTGRRAFLEYWPIVPPDDEPTRLYRKFRWGRLLEVFILDTRQYRSPNAAPDGPGKTMLGAAQRRWLVDSVSASTATWKVVVSSVPLSIPTGSPARRDSWSNASVYGTPQEGGTGFAVERDALLRQLRERGVKNLVFVVADVHHAEIIRHQPAPGWSFHEFVAGPLSARFGRPRPLAEGLNPRSLFARSGVNNFGDVTLAPAHLTVRLYDEEGAVLFTHTIKPDE